MCPVGELIELESTSYRLLSVISYFLTCLSTPLANTPNTADALLSSNTSNSTDLPFNFVSVRTMANTRTPVKAKTPHTVYSYDSGL